MNTATISSRYLQYVARPLARVTPIIVGVVVVVAVFIGWMLHDEEYIVPQSGLGYWLGIIGSLMMLALLIYSYRKRSKSHKSIGSIPTWFRIHMFLGVFGPVLILFHSNFRLGALNSNVALFAMLIVATSGVVGRYIYGKIHMGLYGHKAAAKEIIADVKALRQEFSAKTHLADSIFDELDAFGSQIFERPGSNALESLRFGAIQAIRSWQLRAHLSSKMRHLVEVEGRSKGWSRKEIRSRLEELQEITTIYFNAVLKAAELRFYERLFNLWHVLHLPLFFLMVVVVLVHIWAAHRY
jgi:hypothetical protein